MRLTALKPIRVAVSLIFFFLILWIFLDTTGKVSHEVARGILIFQLVPSLVTLFTFVTGASLGCAAVFLLTLLFGRVYCSFLCPLGTLHDLVIGLKTRIRRKKRFRFQQPQPWLQYGLLAITVIPLFFGSLFFLNMLDPYSISGRIFSDLFRPVWYGAINLTAWVLKQFNDFSVYPVEFRHLPVIPFLITAVIFTGIVLLALFRGRWYCNAICPAGTVLGLVSRFSLFRIRIREDQCTSCGLCVRNCKAGCIDMKQSRVDFSRCVACYNCLRTCNNDGFSYGISRKSGVLPADPSRRRFLKQTATGIPGAVALWAAVPLVAQNTALPGAQETTGTAQSQPPATPPGSGNRWRFTSACTACHLCISACPTQVLQPSFVEYGLSGLFIPKMNFEVSYCNFDCIRCTEVCPNEAIRTLTIEEKHVTQIGVSKLIKNLCVVVEKKTACGACSEHCPTKAVEMVPYLGTLKIPEINEKICVGCGACEHVCPTRPVRAIYVEPHAYHRVAMKPLKKVEAPKEIKKQEEEFPF